LTTLNIVFEIRISSRRHIYLPDGIFGQRTPSQICVNYHPRGVDYPAQPWTVHVKDPLGSCSGHTIESKVDRVCDPSIQDQASDVIYLHPDSVLDHQLRHFAEKILYFGVIQDRIHLGDAAKQRFIRGFLRHNWEIIKEIGEKQNAERSLLWLS
jgi:hypothetical protein